MVYRRLTFTTSMYLLCIGLVGTTSGISIISCEGVITSSSVWVPWTRHIRSRKNAETTLWDLLPSTFIHTPIRSRHRHSLTWVYSVQALTRWVLSWALLAPDRVCPSAVCWSWLDSLTYNAACVHGNGRLSRVATFLTMLRIWHWWVILPICSTISLDNIQGYWLLVTRCVKMLS